ncbi:DUF262 domain-containing protein [Nocardioides coralli]|uniref:DUF262 domain-containing protein n=1 Tax=Nocardioides coralli TaxID=2872154 RepID=UPI001CA3D9C2|nr:DUF262 domain-containing HNH endonuclease family protein [Nocardioides coralli]QZY29688.1 DUF262 domain-containing HNH endonuclease family protein [Nocardioides coralli]
MGTTEVDALFKPTSASIRQLLSDLVGGFCIPSYQRPYRWKPADLRRLCEDLIAGLQRLSSDESAVSFIGAIITVSGISDLHDTKPSDARQVIDGQQRLTTILMLAVALHERLGQQQGSVDTSSLPEEVRDWCTEQIAETRGGLFACLGQVRQSGDAAFRNLPKLVRDVSDIWSAKQSKAQYRSPISRLLIGYIQHDGTNTYSPTLPSSIVMPEAPGSSLADFETVNRRYQSIKELVRDLARGREGDLADAIDLDVLLGPSSKALPALFENVTDTLAPSLRTAALTSTQLSEALRLLLLSRFLLERVALTQINAKDEAYAFDLFDSLNTTGEPLTALETFLPLVVEAEGVEKYPTSPSFEHMSLTSRLLGDDDNVQRQAERLVTMFLLSDAGLKVPNKHNDQRRELNKRYKSAENADQQRAMTRYLADCSLTYFHMWQELELSTGATGVEGHLDDQSLFALRFLNQINHTVVLAPLARYFAAWRKDPSVQTVSALQAAIKSSTAFSVLWRAAHGGTDGIDGIYRKIMSSGVDGICAPLARTAGSSHDERELPDVSALAAAYRHHLAGANGYSFSSKSDWLAHVAGRPIYDEQFELSRFLLLLAAHHAVPEETSGLTKDGAKADHTDMLKPDRYTTDDRLATVEHVAPQNPTPDDWAIDLYASPSAIPVLGNLTLLPLDDNSFISNRPWNEKRRLYSALSAESPDAARALLEAAVKEGVSLSPEKIDFLVGRRLHLPVLQAIANYEGEWDRDFIDQRTRNLLERAWTVLDGWLST